MHKDCSIGKKKMKPGFSGLNRKSTSVPEYVFLRWRDGYSGEWHIRLGTLYRGW